MNYSLFVLATRRFLDRTVLSTVRWRWWRGCTGTVKLKAARGPERESQFCHSAVSFTVRGIQLDAGERAENGAIHKLCALYFSGSIETMKYY